ncbi:MAG: UDP-N-acetylmuramoyl-L-alanyl-D-glutamate--2,6-diaminopimelate ligase [Kiritimatiellae bacterium]|nr:UDP-N-acetylmuramoyl-L-alanyl-D-glutamate--2,6-diaminopimelate ligase [Kiritimatiellia bacterium]
MNVWGITGTNGKTTVTWVLAEFFRAAGRKCGYVTTVEVDTGLRKFSTGYTTPPLNVLKEIFAEMEMNGLSDCVMEVSSHAIHQRRFGDTVFAGGAFTNLTEDHLDYHKTMEAYFDAKLDFARIVASQHPVKPSAGRREMPPYAVCLDGGSGMEMFDAAGVFPLNVLPVSIARPEFDLSDLKLAGEYNKSNVLLAAALARAAGVEHDAIQSAIPRLQPRWGRLEEVQCKSKARVFVDYAHTDDALRNVLSAVKKFTAGRVWAVFGAGGDRDPMKRPLMGKAASETADVLVVTSDNPRSEDPDSIISQIAGGIKDHCNVKVEPDRRKAIFSALAGAEAGDAVVVCGKGHETTQEIKGVKFPFDDREVCKEFCWDF